MSAAVQIPASLLPTTDNGAIVAAESADSTTAAAVVAAVLLSCRIDTGGDLITNGSGAVFFMGGVFCSPNKNLFRSPFMLDYFVCLFLLVYIHFKQNKTRCIDGRSIETLDT
jgi:hypothetical protein